MSPRNLEIKRATMQARAKRLSRAGRLTASAREGLPLPSEMVA